MARKKGLGRDDGRQPLHDNTMFLTFGDLVDARAFPSNSVNGRMLDSWIADRGEVGEIALAASCMV